MFRRFALTFLIPCCAALGFASLSLAQYTNDWMYHYHTPLPTSNNSGNAIAVDATGNTYVAMSSFRAGTNNDYAVTKYRPDGSTEWVARYDSPGHGNDSPHGIAVDSAGYVVVTGWSDYNNTNDFDGVTVGLSPTGIQRWVLRHRGTGNNWEGMEKVVMDSQGSAYVVGLLDNFGTGSDIYTIKILRSGVIAWGATYNNTQQNSADEGADIAIAPGTGDVYVTGGSYRGSGQADIITIKYNPTGQQQWVKTYNGPGNDFDAGTRIAVDFFGAVWVVGESTGAGTGRDYAVLAYGSNGIGGLMARYSGPGNGRDAPTGLAVDMSENAYVTGYSLAADGKYDIATVRVSPNAFIVWTQRYRAPSGNNSYGSDLALDQNRNAIVVGSQDGIGSNQDYIALKYDTGGNPIYQVDYNGPGNAVDAARAVALDADGNAFITGGSRTTATNFDCVTMKLDTAGNRLWLSRYEGYLAQDSEARALAVDQYGNAYGTGITGPISNANMGIFKVSTYGVPAWQIFYDGTSHLGDGGLGLALDASANVFVAGYQSRTGASTDWIMAKYDTNGVQQFFQTLGGSGRDESYRVVVDAKGNAYYAGITTQAGTNQDLFITKKDPVGNTVWSNTWAGAGGSYEYLNAMALDASGNVYLAGGSTTVNEDYVLVKFDASGAFVWSQTYDWGGSDEALDLKIDPAGNPVMTGVASRDGKVADAGTLKYDPDGNLLWAARFDGTAQGFDVGSALVVDSLGRIFVAGSTASTGTSDDILVLCYDSKGNVLWSDTYAGPVDSDFGSAICIDSHGLIYVAGSSNGGNTSYDLVVLKYAATGRRWWETRIATYGQEQASSIACDRYGNLTVAGGLYNVDTGWEFALWHWKYGPFQGGGGDID